MVGSVREREGMGVVVRGELVGSVRERVCLKRAGVAVAVAVVDGPTSFAHRVLDELPCIF